MTNTGILLSPNTVRKNQGKFVISMNIFKHLLRHVIRFLLPGTYCTNCKLGLWPNDDQSENRVCFISYFFLIFMKLLEIVCRLGKSREPILFILSTRSPCMLTPHLFTHIVCLFQSVFNSDGKHFVGSTKLCPPSQPG